MVAGANVLSREPNAVSQRQGDFLEAHMLDYSRTDSTASSDADSPDSDRDRTQYTVKGIDRDTVDLMRGAARKDGMKIGAWVSAKLREAAHRSFGAGGSDSDPAALLDHLSKLMLEYQEQSDQRLRKIENELLEITSGQRTIMNKVISKL